MSEPFDPNLLAHYRPSLYSYAVKEVRDRALAEDLVQETLLAALEPAGQCFAGRSSLRTWLLGILKHKIVDAFRARVKTPVSYDEPANSALLERLAAASDPEAATACKRFLEACDRRLARMPAQGVDAFVLTEVLGHDTSDVCAMLGITKANLWTTVHRVRRALRESLDRDSEPRKASRNPATTAA